MALRLGFGLHDWDLDLETGNWVSRLKFGPRDWDLRGGTKKEKEKEEEEEEEEKIPHMCESIGHRPLLGRCPKRGKKKMKWILNQSGTILRMNDERQKK